MYVCICNGLTERHVRDAAEAGASLPSDVYQAFGCEMQCGTCEQAIACIVERIAGPPIGRGAGQESPFAGQVAAV